MTPNLLESTIPSCFLLKVLPLNLGLLCHYTLHDNKTPMNTKVKHSYMRALPLHFHTALQKWALPTQEKMASPLDHKYLNIWSKDPRVSVFGAIPNAFSSKFLASLFAILCMVVHHASCPKTLKNGLVLILPPQHGKRLF